MIPIPKTAIKTHPVTSRFSHFVVRDARGCECDGLVVLTFDFDCLLCSGMACAAAPMFCNVVRIKGSFSSPTNISSSKKAPGGRTCSSFDRLKLP